MFNLAIIGAGPAGYVAAQRAAAKGLSVVLFEKKELGGVCLNEGCIPTKTLLHSAHLYELSLKADKYGVFAESVKFDYAKIWARKEKVTKKLVGAIKASMRNLEVEVVRGEAKILGGSIGNFRIESEEQIYEAEKILICTGSKTFIPPIKGLEYPSEHILTSKEALELKQIPESITIVGGGVIGMEFASLYSSFGSKVKVIEATDKILGPIDAEISTLLQNALQQKGVEFHLNTKLSEIEDSEYYLICVGRKAEIGGIGIENIGLNSEAGALKVDEHMRTEVDGVYAAGDVTAKSMLAHSASRQAEVAVNDILGIEDSMSYKAIPGVVYTHPEVASVGFSEEALKKQGIAYEVVKLPMTYSGRFVVENERGNGLCKLLFTMESDNRKARLLGAHMIGNPCSEIIASCCMAIENNMTREDILKVIFPHPSVGEILKECCFEG